MDKEKIINMILSVDKDKIINITLAVVILAAIFGGRHYYLQKSQRDDMIENVQKKIERIQKDVSGLKSKMNQLGIRRLNIEKARWEKTQERLQEELDKI